MTSTALPASAARVAAPAPPAAPHEAALRDALARLDLPALAERFAADDGLVVLPDLLPPALVSAMTAEARRLAPGARRTFVPFFRRAGAVGHHDIEARAPALLALQRSPSLHAFAQRLAGVPLEHRRPHDAHASGLYVYDRPGDYVGWHYDDCGCVADASFTVIAGVVDDSESRLEVELHTKQDQNQKQEPPARSGAPRRAVERRAIATRPGTVAFFRGSSIHHRVTPLRRGEQRISFSFVYVKEGLHPTGFDRLWQTGIDTILYFGWKGLPRRTR